MTPPLHTHVASIPGEPKKQSPFSLVGDHLLFMVLASAAVADCPRRSEEVILSGGERDMYGVVVIVILIE